MRRNVRWIGPLVLVGLVLLFDPADWLPRSHGEAAIAFTSDRGDRCCRIYAGSRDGADLRELSPTNGHSPAWSPDGSRIAFVHWTRGTSGGGSDQEIYVMDADGDNPERVTANTLRDDDPTWSPDGRSLAFVRGPEESSHVYVRDLETGEERRLTASGGLNLDPAWAPRGRSVAYVRQAGGWSSLYVVDVDRGTLRLVLKIPSLAESPTWHPNGRWIAYGQGKSIHRVRVDGVGLERLHRQDQWLRHTAWSPDGTEIAFVSVVNGGLIAPDFWQIDALDLQTRRTRRITSAHGDLEPAWRP